MEFLHLYLFLSVIYLFGFGGIIYACHYPETFYPYFFGLLSNFYNTYINKHVVSYGFTFFTNYCAIKNKFNKYYWLRKIYTSKLFQLLQIKNSKLKKKIFTSIYKSNHWVQNGDSLPQEFVSVSGHGSNIGTDQHKQLVNNFTNIIEKYEIDSILDMPCGDFLWIKEVVKNNDIKYLGIDIVEELIKNNNLKF